MEDEEVVTLTLMLFLSSLFKNFIFALVSLHIYSSPSSLITLG